jgi:hypothetical protein
MSTNVKQRITLSRRKQSTISIFVFLLLIVSKGTFAQDRLEGRELSINMFRNPSVGLEFRRNHLSVHAGYYPTNFESGVTTSFIRTGATYWFLPFSRKEKPSSFYTSLSYLRGLDRDYEDRNAMIAEAGVRWMIVKGLNLRLGVATLYSPGRKVQVNPTPGISYSFFFKQR